NRGGNIGQDDLVIKPYVQHCAVISYSSRMYSPVFEIDSHEIQICLSDINSVRHNSHRIRAQITVLKIITTRPVIKRIEEDGGAVCATADAEIVGIGGANILDSERDSIAARGGSRVGAGVRNLELKACIEASRGGLRIRLPYIAQLARS